MRGFYFISRALRACFFAVFSRIARSATESGIGTIRFRTRIFLFLGAVRFRITRLQNFVGAMAPFFIFNQKEFLCLFQ